MKSLSKKTTFILFATVLSTGLYLAIGRAAASFGVDHFTAYIEHPVNVTETQGMPLYFESEHSGHISHYRTNVWENCSIRGVLGYTDPPGHPPPAMHVVKEQFTYGTFPPGSDGELSFGMPSPVVLSENAAVDWTCSLAYHYLSWAKTTFTLNGGTPTTGAYSEAVFHSTP